MQKINIRAEKECGWYYYYFSVNGEKRVRLPSIEESPGYVLEVHAFIEIFLLKEPK